MTLSYINNYSLLILNYELVSEVGQAGDTK